MFVRLLKLPPEVRRRYDLSSLRFVTHAAAPCPADIKRQMIEWWGPVINEYYGGTETGGAVFHTSAEALRKPGTVGRPINGAAVKIFDPAGKELGPGEIGEVYIRIGGFPDFTYHGMGRRSQSDNESWHVLLAPSQIPEKVHREIPHEMDADQIAMIVRAFGDAVRRSREGGLDGVELSFAHNHLVDQFWSPVFNQRTDEYGGTLDNRMRFGFEVLREIRRQVGRDYVVGARISGDEFTDGGLTAEDMAFCFAAMLKPSFARSSCAPAI